MNPRGYRDLAVWRRSKALAIEVYRVTGTGSLGKDWGLRDQMRRSAVSAPSNIAEGQSRGSSRDSVRFYYIARGSLAELSTQAEIAAAVGLVDVIVATTWQSECDELRSMLTRLIRVTN